MKRLQVGSKRVTLDCQVKRKSQQPTMTVNRIYRPDPAFVAAQLLILLREGLRERR